MPQSRIQATVHPWIAQNGRSTHDQTTACHCPRHCSPSCVPCLLCAHHPRCCCPAASAEASIDMSFQSQSKTSVMYSTTLVATRVCTPLHTDALSPALAGCEAHLCHAPGRQRTCQQAPMIIPGSHKLLQHQCRRSAARRFLKWQARPGRSAGRMSLQQPWPGQAGRKDQRQRQHRCVSWTRGSCSGLAAFSCLMLMPLRPTSIQSRFQ